MVKFLLFEVVFVGDQEEFVFDEEVVEDYVGEGADYFLVGVQQCYYAHDEFQRAGIIVIVELEGVHEGEGVAEGVGVEGGSVLDDDVFLLV